ncbi:MAG: aminotransferase class I/II-fold pyridoxal phosphate-dependent enzyme, partial [Clostridia bacterium]|nr:aminotransferase class I/II-fold pyridoxal phosphate-dependent enzyme [Clostridia bacterium]
MKYNFDEIIDRTNSNSLKFDFTAERKKPQGVLPLWVADMDFRAPQEVLDALSEKIKHGVFGYSDPKEDYFAAVRSWFSAHYGWEPESRKLLQTCGVVYSICTLLEALTQEEDSVIICQPVYYPFEESIVENNRKLVVSELKYENGSYQIDFEDFERKIEEEDVKLFILCNPHNPVGRVWTREELTRLSEICYRHNVFVIADEIHADFVYKPHVFTSYATLGE